MLYKYIVKCGQERRCTVWWKTKQTYSYFRSGNKFYSSPLVHPEVRKIEFTNNSIYGFNEIITLTFKMPESVRRFGL